MDNNEINNLANNQNYNTIYYSNKDKNNEISDKIEETFNKNLKYEEHINNISILSNQNLFIQKINELKKLLKSNSNQKNCNIHSLPLNIICIDEKIKICSQCALNDKHSNHQIITENDFIINIDKLIELYQKIDKYQIKYLSNNNANNSKNVIENINHNIIQLIDFVDKTKEKIIQNINKQIEKILNFLNRRKNEIEIKYKNNNFDSNNLRESALNWMKIVVNKLNKINDINENNFDLIKLIDEENDKNISNLIRAGKQIKDRFLFAKESFKIIQNLNEYKNYGIKIEPNYKIISNIVSLNNIENAKENYFCKDINNEENQKDIKITLFNIEENYNLLKLLHLELSEFSIKEKIRMNSTNNKKNTLENEKKNSGNKKPDRSLINLDEINIDDTLLISPPHRTSHKNSPSTQKLIKNIQNNNLESINNLENKKEVINNNNSYINPKTSNSIITKKIVGLNSLNIKNNKNKDINLMSNKRNNSKEKTDTNNIKKIQLKDNSIRSLYKLNSEEKIKTSYSRSPPSRKNDNYQSIKLDNIYWNNSNKREKKIKVGLNNKMNNYLYKNKDNKNSSKLLIKKNRLSINKNNFLTRRNSKEKENLNILNISSFNKKKLKINNSKLSLRNHGSKKSISSLYSEQNLIDLKTNRISNIDNKNKENNIYNIKFDILNHYNNTKNNEINNKNDNYNLQNITKKNIIPCNNINYNINEPIEIKNQKELQNIVLTQMRSLTPNFSRINMNGIGMQLICSYLHKNPNNKYKELKLLGCNLEDDDLLLLVKTLLDHNINILILNLSNNKIGDESAANILDLVKEHQTLKGLSLYNNLISDLLKEKLKEYTELGRENLHSIQLYI